MSITALSIKLILLDYENDWYVLSREEHDGKEWWEQRQNCQCWMMSRRLEPTTDVEGTGFEWLRIAEAIENNKTASFKRCEAEPCDIGYLLSSPRNSREPVLIDHESAKYLAAQIRTMLK